MVPEENVVNYCLIKGEMMEQKTLKGYVRTELKKGAVGRLRRSGKIPAVIYGHSESVSIAVDELEFNKKYRRRSENTIISIQIGDKIRDVIIKNIQDNLIIDKIIHIDFYEIEKGKALKVNIPVYLVGTSQGVKEGGVIDQLLHEIEVECLPKDIPEKIEIDISELLVGSSIHIKEIIPPKGVKILNQEDQVIVVITHIKEEIVEEEEEIEGEEEEIEGEEETVEEE